MADEEDFRKPRDLARIEALFHGLILSRCAEGGIKVPEELPSLANLRFGEKETYFPVVEGMYGVSRSNWKSGMVNPA